MFAKSRVVFAVLVAALACPPVVVIAQSGVQQERIAASFVLALGRTPTPVEVERWTALQALSVADLVARHRRELQGDAAAAQAVTMKASHDALGRAPGGDDVKSLPGGAMYVDLMQRHLRWLAEHPADYEQVVHRAYRLLLQRDAYSIELDYWKRQPALSYALLVGCIEDWARRNQPGLMATTGVATVSVNSAYLDTIRLSPAVAAEARVAAGLAPAGNRALAAAVGRTVVAPGAEQVASVAGIHFAAAGAVNLVPAAGR